MKRLLLSILTTVLLTTVCSTTSLHAAETIKGYGLPFVTNYSPKEYNAHAINYDITADNYGNVFVANFEGLLYYNGRATFQKIHTPGISRITQVERDRNGRIWLGGHNVFGYLEPGKNGELVLHTIVSDLGTFHLGEVDGLTCKGNTVFVHTNKGATYYVKNGNSLKRCNVAVDFNTEQTAKFKNYGFSVDIKHAEGLLFHDDATGILMTDKDGLCSNIINAIYYDGHHTLWGATNNGIFAIEVPSAFTHLGEAQGLRGEVYAINQLHDTFYAGTLQGLFRIGAVSATQVNGIQSACWDIIDFGADELLAASSEGTVRIKANGSTQRLNSHNTTAVCLGETEEDIYAGELDGIYHYKKDGTQRKRISDIGNLLTLHYIGTSLIAETVNGQRWEIPLDPSKKPILRRKRIDATKPELEIDDIYGRVWTTGANSKNLTLNTEKSRYNALKLWVKPLSHLSINDIYSDTEESVMVGGAFGVIYCNITSNGNTFLTYSEKAIPVYIRDLSMGNEILWGGYTQNMHPKRFVEGLKIPSDCNSLTITYSVQDRMAVTPVAYRYRINNDRWSEWDSNEVLRINNISYGTSTVEIVARDMFGRTTPAAQVKWFKEYPLYLRWYAIGLYVILIAGGIIEISKWRTRKLIQAKEELEQTVSERTSELSSALNNLRKAQSELVRMERVATAGKLTQGLIDRILNPINYINNFAKLSSGLATDLAADIEDEKDRMGEDNYEDCLDILQMMKQNLEKIEQHGVNTTRMLRAMEAMLNTTVKELRDTNLNAVCQQAINMVIEYHKTKPDAEGISVVANLPEQTITKPMDGEAFCSTLIAIITNAVYAVTKRKHKTTSDTYKPEVTLTLTANEDGTATITIRDNGIGIEEAIRSKIFDPFFTTKTTSEAAGVGLYLAREVVQAHHGTIELATASGQTDFIITL